MGQGRPPRRLHDDTRHLVPVGIERGREGGQVVVLEGDDRIGQAGRDALRLDTGQQVAMMAASVRSEANKTLASLRTNLASVTLEAGKLKEAAANIGLQAGQIRAGIEGQKNDLAKFAVETMLSSQQGMLQLQQLIGSLNQFKTQLRSNAQIQALEYDLRGRVQSAEQTFRNPETVVGILSGLLAIAGVQTAPGGRNLPGVRF